jgi:hypothetical protein
VESTNARRRRNVTEFPAFKDDHNTKVRERGGAETGGRGKRRREGGRQEAEMRDARVLFLQCNEQVYEIAARGGFNAQNPEEWPPEVVSSVLQRIFLFFLASQTLHKKKLCNTTVVAQCTEIQK